MRNPNGYGSVIKLGGNRRRPYAIRISIGWTDDANQKFEYLGYYRTRKEAILALADYNRNPYDLNDAKMTFCEIYEKWSAERFPKLNESSIASYRATFKNHCSSIYNKRFVNLKASHLQEVVDQCKKSNATKKNIVVLFNQLYTFAMKNDMISKNYAQYVKVGSSAPLKERNVFSNEEIQLLWNLHNKSNDDYVQIVLMLIYSGLRISELLDLKKEHVHLDEQYIEIVKSKTAAGIRKVPIAKKTLAFFKDWMIKRPNFEYLLFSKKGHHFSYDHYWSKFWKPLMSEIQIDHTPHETRHTTISLLTEANTNPTVIKKIVGHSGAMNMTEKRYTHLDIKPLLDAINKI